MTASKTFLNMCSHIQPEEKLTDLVLELSLLQDMNVFLGLKTNLVIVASSGLRSQGVV